jgi:hypothetical protein
MHRARNFFLLLSLLLAVLVSMPTRPAAAGAASDFGYIWRLSFPFEGSYDGTLTIETGKMENGVMLELHETSTSSVPCRRVGPVNLVAGAAVFNGGYLRCSFDLAGALLANHGIAAPPTDSYNRMTVRASLAATAFDLAPILTHPDLAYQIDFDGGDNVLMRQGLATSAGQATANATFNGMFGGTQRNYGFVYGCLPAGGPCSAEHYAGTAVQGGPVAGGPVRMRTGSVALLIGGDGATSFFGGIDELIVDPGNTIPGS